MHRNTNLATTNETNEIFQEQVVASTIEQEVSFLVFQIIPHA